MLKRTDYLTKHYGKPDAWSFALYERDGGYRAARKALTMSREAVVEEIKKAHIRGRGGAGFDCGTKMSFMPKESKKPHYLVINGDEGEPGTFKDRSIMEMNPHSLVEGCIIGAPDGAGNSANTRGVLRDGREQDELKERQSQFSRCKKHTRSGPHPAGATLPAANL